MRISLPTEETIENKGNPAAEFQEDFLETKSMTQSQKWKHNMGKEQKKWKDMSSSERLTYFRDYYAKKTIIAIIVFIAIIGIGRAVYQNFQPTDLTLVILNYEYSKSKLDSFEKAYREASSVPSNHKIELIANMDINYSTYQVDLYSTDPNSASSYEILTAYVRSDYLDAIISDKDALDYLVNMDLVFNLTYIFPEDKLNELKDYIVYMDVPANSPDETGDDVEMISVPIALDISKCEKISALSLPYENVYLTFPCSGEKNLTNATTLIEFILGGR